MRRAVALCGCILVAAACAAGGPSLSNERPHLGVSNGTTLAVTLVVNGQTVATFEPGEPGPELDRISLPALPWTVEARSPAGRILTTMTVEPGDARSTTRPDGQVDMAGKMGRVDLSCGRLTIWAGISSHRAPRRRHLPGRRATACPRTRAHPTPGRPVLR